MATLSDSAGGGGGGRAGAELMVPQFHLKALHAILAVRAPRPLAAAPAPAASFRRRDRWFHLPLHAPPPPASAEHLPEPSPGEPLVVDVYLTPSGGGGGAEAVVERWTVSCEPWSAGARGGGGAAASGEGLAVNRAYKRCITLLRSVYTALRLLPAYRVFRLLCASGQAYNYEMGFRVGSFAAPFTRAEEAAMSTRRFAPPAFPPRRPNSWAPSPAPWPYTPGQQAKFSPPPALYASPTPSPPTFAGGYLQSRLSGETAPMIIPGGGRGPVHNRNMSDPVRGFMLPPPSPKNIRGDSGGHETPMETGRTGIRMADLYTNLPSVPKVIPDFSTFVE
jgi:autophagy-related protein 13